MFVSVSDVFFKNITTPAMHKSNARRAAVFKGLRGLFITLYLQPKTTIQDGCTKNYWHY